MTAPILIADDDDNDVLLMRRALAALNVRNPIEIVHNGDEAIRYLCGDGAYGNRERYPFPVLMMLNLEMPRKNGGEVLAWLQTQLDLPPLKVIVVSGHTDRRPVQQAMHLGAQYFLSKPPDADKLRDILKDLKELRLVPSNGGVHLELASIFAAALIN